MNQQTINTEHTITPYQIPYCTNLVYIQFTIVKKEGNYLIHTYGVHSSILVGEWYIMIIRSKPLLSAKTNADDTTSWQQGHGRFYHPHALDGMGKPISSKVGFEFYSRPIFIIEIVRIQNFKMSIWIQSLTAPLSIIVVVNSKNTALSRLIILNIIQYQQQLLMLWTKYDCVDSPSSKNTEMMRVIFNLGAWSKLILGWIGSWYMMSFN